MFIALGCDHAGLDFKNDLLIRLKSQGYKTLDFGCYKNKSCDYPSYANGVIQAMNSLEADKGILICNNGIGMSIFANRFPKIRAALVYSEETARMTRAHHDSNILCLGGKQFHKAELLRFVDIWLNTSFNKGRHQHRIDKIEKLSS